MSACVCAVMFLSGPASGAGPMQSDRPVSVKESSQQAREALRDRMARYKLPAARHLARDITLEIIGHDPAVLSAAVIDPGGPAS